jgi:type I restriction enzyme S subunit
MEAATKSGFKMTELGLIPSDWEVEELDNLTTLMTNGFVGTIKNIYTENDNGILYIQGYNVEENGFNFNGIKRVLLDFHLKHQKSTLKKNDLLTIQTGDIGVTTIVPEELEGSNCHALVISRFKNFKADSRFYSFYLNSKAGRARLKEIETGTTMKHINVGDMKYFKVPLPPLPEQTAIATALKDTDDLINSLEKLIAKKKRIKQGAMQELLKPKEGWVKKKLGEVATILRGGSPRPIEFYLTTAPDGINWVKIGDVNKEAKYITSTEEKITKEGAQFSRFVNEGDFLLSNSMSFGRPYIMKTNGCIHDGWLVIKEYNSTFDKDFLYYSLGASSVMTQYKSMAAGSGVLNLSKDVVKEVFIEYPSSIEEQIKISCCLSDIDNEIDLLVLKLHKMQITKQGMMQQLLTGKIRLI